MSLVDTHIGGRSAPASVTQQNDLVRFASNFFCVKAAAPHFFDAERAGDVCSCMISLIDMHISGALSHSCLSASTGAIPLARRAGRSVASMAMPNTSTATAANVAGSFAETP